MRDVAAQVGCEGDGRRRVSDLERGAGSRAAYGLRSECVEGGKEGDYLKEKRVGWWMFTQGFASIVLWNN